jgi:hypothetical protein
MRIVLPIRNGTGWIISSSDIIIVSPESNNVTFNLICLSTVLTWALKYFD